jgi:hypothetical protein
MPAPVITQNLSVFRYGSTPVPVLSATGATGQIAWSALWGGFSLALTNNAQNTTYQPVNQSDVITITARDVFDNAVSQAIIEVQATFPYQGNYRNVPRSRDQNTNSSIAEDGSESFTEKGDPQSSFIWKFLMRQQPEWQAVDNFWGWHRRAKSFWLLDVARNDNGNPLIGELIRVRFVEAFQDDPAGADFIDYNCSFRQAVRP